MGKPEKQQIQSWISKLEKFNVELMEYSELAYKESRLSTREHQGLAARRLSLKRTYGRLASVVSKCAGNIALNLPGMDCEVFTFIY